jgi:uncharacterized membrane-anchored protein YitT (DUF2179 family)
VSVQDYLLNGLLVLIVLRQIRWTRLGLTTLVLPIVIVAVVAVEFLRSVPAAGNDIAFDVILAATGAILGSACALTTHMRRDSDGTALARAGVVAAVLWVAGVGARLAFAFWSSHGGGPAIGRFSVAHQITSSSAWVAAIVMMALAEVLARTAVLRLRARSLPRTAVAAPVSVFDH